MLDDGAEGGGLDRKGIMALIASGRAGALGGRRMVVLVIGQTFAGPQAISRLLLLSDGQDESGNSVETLSTQASHFAASQMAVTSLGIGDDFDEGMMIAIAERSGGASHYIRDPGDIVDIFRQELSRLFGVVARWPRTVRPWSA